MGPGLWELGVHPVRGNRQPLCSSTLRTQGAMDAKIEIEDMWSLRPAKATFITRTTSTSTLQRSWLTTQAIPLALRMRNSPERPRPQVDLTLLTPASPAASQHDGPKTQVRSASIGAGGPRYVAPWHADVRVECLACPPKASKQPPSHRSMSVVHACLTMINPASSPKWPTARAERDTLIH